MRSRLYAASAALITAVLLGGCVQATRHSNTMLFGTNTQFGIRAGASASSVPELNIGYSRQEAVIMPLVANTSDNGQYQVPCDTTQDVKVSGGADFAIHPCLLVGVNGKAQDSYSVLASFGAKYDAQAGGTGPKAGGELAQYFATGVAAQMLALKGGASVVAVGDAAKEDANDNGAEADAIAALYGSEAVYERGVAEHDEYSAFQDKLIKAIEATKPEDLAAQITAFESKTGTTSTGVAAECTSVAACVAAVKDNEPYSRAFRSRKDAVEQALSEWKTE